MIDATWPQPGEHVPLPGQLSLLPDRPPRQLTLIDLEPDGDVSLAELDRRCTAARSGTGPPGETCRSCRHCCRLPHASKTFLKCGLCERQWTHGPGSDIRARWPACKFWEATDAKDGQ